MRHLPLHFRWPHRRADPADHAFEKRLGYLLLSMLLFLAINAWLVHASHESGAAPWPGFHPTLVISLNR